MYILQGLRPSLLKNLIKGNRALTKLDIGYAEQNVAEFIWDHLRQLFNSCIRNSSHGLDKDIDKIMACRISLGFRMWEFYNRFCLFLDLQQWENMALNFLAYKVRIITISTSSSNYKYEKAPCITALCWSQTISNQNISIFSSQPLRCNEDPVTGVKYCLQRGEGIAIIVII